QYDGLYRLTKVQHPLLADEQYSYDLVHNRTQRTLTQADGSSQTDSWNYNDDNQLTGYANVSFGYNADGHTIRRSVCNQTEDGAGITATSCQHRYYRYDARERLIAVDEQTDENAVSRIASYQYNELGQRYRKTTAADTTYFLYDQTGLLAEYDESGNLIREYQYTPGATFMTAPLFQRSADNGEHFRYYYYFNDHLGTSQTLISKTGAIVWSANMAA